MASAEFSKFADILSAIAQLVKNLFAMQKTQVQFPGWEDPLEKEMATHSCILAVNVLIVRTDLTRYRQHTSCCGVKRVHQFLPGNHR